MQELDLLGDVASALHRHEFLRNHGLSYKPYSQLPDLAVTLDESHQAAATSWSPVGKTW